MDFKHRDPRRAWPRVGWLRRLFAKDPKPVPTVKIPAGLDCRDRAIEPRRRADLAYQLWLAEWRARQAELADDIHLDPEVPALLRRQAG